MNLFLRLLWVRLAALWRPKLSLWDRAVTPFRVAPSDLDVLFHMNNGKYLSLMDLGRIDLMLRSGFWGKVTKRGWYPVVAGQTITYRKSLNPGQAFELHTSIIGFHDNWAYVQQVFKVGDVVHAHAIVRARFRKKSGGTVPEEDIIAMAGELPHHGVPQWIIEWSEHTKNP